MNILISGASGFVGGALTASLIRSGHDVRRLARPSSGPIEGSTIAWNPGVEDLDPRLLEDVDAIVNLNGRSIAGKRWSAREKEMLRESRLAPTRTLVEAIAACDRPPSLLVNASAVGIYGNRGDEVVDEDSTCADDFLAGLAVDWEAEAARARSDRTRVAAVRLGMVLGEAGALGRMLLPFRLGLGGPIGDGRQWWSWIGLDDVVGAIAFILEHGSVDGPVNLVSPSPARCRDFARTLGRVLHRPAFLPLPSFAARLALGEMADGLLLASTRVRPAVLEREGYRFTGPDLELTLKGILGES